MRIVLLQDVPKVGRKFEEKDVADGFGRNVLVAKNLALVVTPENLKKIKAAKDAHDAHLQAKKDSAEKAVRELDGSEIKLTGKANDEGHLFASIHKGEIIEAVKNTKGLELGADWIELDKPLKTIGEHEVGINAGGKKGKVKIIIISA